MRFTMREEAHITSSGFLPRMPQRVRDLRDIRARFHLREEHELDGVEEFECNAERGKETRVTAPDQALQLLCIQPACDSACKAVSGKPLKTIDGRLPASRTPLAFVKLARIVVD